MCVIEKKNNRKINDEENNKKLNYSILKWKQNDIWLFFYFLQATDHTVKYSLAPHNDGKKFPRTSDFDFHSVINSI